ncbi:4-hydroxy-3-methylbut-2-enyl diphosphate reductase [Candidatus Dependentiae bacterium]|nr:4-hydroxy-3-methylbut-2-enyl diphosphate reductase [Candidatus Dependentiae bacterium]
MAENSGFCFGVKRAVTAAYDILKQKKPETKVYILGDIIHNPSVVKELENLGAIRVNNIDEITDIKDAVLIIRSHGVSRQSLKRAEGLGLKVINSTCPFVKKIEDYIESLLNENYQAVIVGDKNHPEVNSLLETFTSKVIVIEKADDVKKIEKFQNKAGVVAQTTQTLDNFKECISALIEKNKELKIYNSICEATEKRQNSSADLAKRVDIVIVIGGKNSANTTRLYQICKKINLNTVHIENFDEFKKEWIENVKIVGITAGASTPGWIIEDVVDKIKKIDNNNK